MKSGDALRYRREIAPFVGRKGSAETLKDLVEPGEEIVFVSEVDPGSGFTLISEGRVHQMIWNGSRRENLAPAAIVPLPASQAGAMLRLTELAFPGYFRIDTYKLGAYFGIYAEGELVAMAGERMQIGNYREVSAICTHHDFRGRGYARALTECVTQNILAEGMIPFLHVGESNAQAIALYQSLGFQFRIALPVLRFQRMGS